MCTVYTEIIINLLFTWPNIKLFLTIQIFLKQMAMKIFRIRNNKFPTQKNVITGFSTGARAKLAKS